MDEAIDEELKLGELMRLDISKELDVLQTVSSSLLMLDLKRKLLESHFDSLVEMIDRKRNEAVEVIRVREEKRFEELRLKEVRIESLRKGVFGEIFLRSKGIDEEIERLERFEESLKVRDVDIERRVEDFERRVAEFEVREKEMVEAKMDVERLCVELIGKEREIGRMKMEDEKLFEENLALREEVKLLTEKLELKSKVPGREEQLELIQKFLNLLTTEGIIKICKPIKESNFRGQELFIIAMDNINNQGAAISKVSSALLEAKESAPELVVKALEVSYLSELIQNNSRSLLGACRILLLEQLNHICPQNKSQARNEALKVALEWSARIENCVLKPVGVSRFLQFVSMYDIVSEFSNEVLVPLLHYIAVQEGMPDFCFKLGFSNKISGYIKALIETKERLKALDYVTTFKMTKEFSVVKIIRGHLKGLKNNCERMLKDGVDRKAAEIQVLDLQINTLKELVMCIKDLKLQSIFTTENLEERLGELETMKYLNKRPTPCSDLISDPEPPRKKLCNLPGTAKSQKDILITSTVCPENRLRDVLTSDLTSDPEPPRKKACSLPETAKSQKVIPNTSNVHPENGLIDLPSSGLSSDPDPLMNSRCKLHEMSKSAEVTLNASIVIPDVRSGGLLSSNRYGLPESQSKNECKLPGTPRLMEVAQNTSNAYSESGSTCVVSLKSSSDLEPLSSKDNNLPETAKLTEVASNTSNAYLEVVSRDALCLKPCVNREPLTNIGCNLPGPAKPHNISSNGTLNASTENAPKDLISFNPNGYPQLQPQRTNDCKLTGSTKFMEVDQSTSNAIPETGIRDMFSSKPKSYPETLRNGGFDLRRTAKLREVVLNTSNAYPKIVPIGAFCSQPNINNEPWSNKRCNFPGPAKPQETAPKGMPKVCTEIGSRNTLHFQEMQKASFQYDQPQFRYGAPAGYPLISTSRPSGYQPPIQPRPLQYYHPCPPLAGNQQFQVPSFPLSVPNRPLFDHRR